MERVKVYSSKHNDEWEDEGTGYLRFEEAGDSEKTGLTVMNEDGSAILLKHEIGVMADDYSLQEDSRIIRWTERASEIHRALSFEHEQHCREVFGKLQKTCGPATAEEEEVTSAASAEKLLPELTLSSLETMAKMFGDGQPLSRVCASNMIPQLVDVFQQCEDLEDVPSLENCCRLARSLVLHADFTTAEELFSEAHALHVIGALEYDPDIPIRIKHRKFLKEKVTFKEVVPISDPEIVRRIHRIYRMQYVKDVVLPRLMDEPMMSCLSQMIMISNVEVVNALSVHSTFFEALFSRIRDYDASTQQWRDLVGFLQEYCLLLRQLQPANQLGILMKMNKLGLFAVLTNVLRDGSPEVKLKVVDILNSSMAQDPSALRRHISLTPERPLLQLLVETLVTGDTLGLTEHGLEVIRSLLEPTEEATNKFDSFLEIFYNAFFHYLADALSVGTSIKPETSKTTLKLPEKVSARAKGAILELFSFCAQTHTYMFKCYLLRANVLERVTVLLKAKERWLVASVVRFIRTLLGMKEEFFDRIIHRSNTLGHIVELFMENGDRNNLLNSSILELFDFLRKEKRHDHISQVVEQYHDPLASVSYVTTFKEMKNEYDKKREGGCSLDTQMMSTDIIRSKRDSRALEREEEDYFAEGSDDNELMQDLSQAGSEMDVDQETNSTDRCKRILTGTSPSAKRLRGDATTSTAETTPRPRDEQGET